MEEQELRYLEKPSTKYDSIGVRGGEFGGSQNGDQQPWRIIKQLDLLKTIAVIDM